MDIQHTVTEDSENVAEPPIFEGEVVSEEELRGADPDEPSEEETAEEEKSAEPESSSEDDQEAAAAVAEVQSLQHELLDLQRELNELKGEGTAEEQGEADDGEFKDFKVLSDEEYEEFLEDDPVEAIKYERKLRRYEDRQKENQKREELQKRGEESIIQSSVEYMKNIVPGLYDEESQIAKDLVEFATSNGLEDEYLVVLTEPSTKVVIEDPKNPKKKITVPLGPAAAALTKMIHNVYQTSKRTETGGGSGKGLGSALTEEKFSKLSPEEQEKVLRAP